jgi:hypothetical protein
MRSLSIPESGSYRTVNCKVQETLWLAPLR